jgi:hypothetical protein
MLQGIKAHFSNRHNIMFWIFFGPAMIMTLSGVFELYTTYFDALTMQDHLQFFLRFFFPLSVALFVSALERRQRLKRALLVKGIERYLKRSIK